MNLNPYLFYDGDCAEAFRFYAEVTGWQLETMMTYGDSPECDEIPAVHHDRIIHASLATGNGVLMASDCLPGQYRDPAGTALAVSLDDANEARRVFDTLSEGGRVDMPLEETFFAHAFGMLTDRFGVAWMISVLRTDGDCGDDDLTGHEPGG